MTKTEAAELRGKMGHEKANKLIAEFMGAYKDANNHWDFEGCDFHFQGCTSTEPMLFHKSWDWLMPVVEKIKVYVKERDFKYTPLGAKWNAIQLTLISIDILQLYEGVVNFIQWYNENKEK